MKKIALIIMAVAIAASAAHLVSCRYEGRSMRDGRYVTGYWGLYDGQDGYFEYFSGDRYCPYNL